MDKLSVLRTRLLSKVLVCRDSKGWSVSGDTMTCDRFLQAGV